MSRAASARATTRVQRRTGAPTPQGSTQGSAAWVSPEGRGTDVRWPQEERLKQVVDLGVPIVSLFWGDPAPLVPIAHAGGALVMHTVGSAEEARRAVEAGVDIVVAQGWEAGGHVWGSVASLPLIATGTFLHGPAGDLEHIAVGRPRRTYPDPVPPPTVRPSHDFRLAEPLAALSLVSDMARARPPGEAMRACLVATERFTLSWPCPDAAPNSAGGRSRWLRSQS